MNRILTVMATAMLVTAGVASPTQAETNNPCHLILHRGLHTNTSDEETISAVRGAAKYGFGAEIDARVALDGLVAVHDDTLSRISGYTDRRAPETMTMAQLKQVHLKYGGQLASVRQLVHVAKTSGSKLLIEGKRYPEHTQAWDNYGLELIAQAIRQEHMTGRVYVGGTLGFTRAFHSVAPNIMTFWRSDRDEPLNLENASHFWADIVEADAPRWTQHSVKVYRHHNIIPATRNADTVREWRAAWKAGVRVWQTNKPNAAATWCQQKGK